jgi:hypothetical protein
MLRPLALVLVAGFTFRVVAGGFVSLKIFCIAFDAVLRIGYLPVVPSSAESTIGAGWVVADHSSRYSKLSDTSPGAS